MGERDGKVQDGDIVVTQEMIEAGVFHLNNYNPERDSGFEFVTRLYRSMYRAKSGN